jgi:hypothetical protein
MVAGASSPALVGVLSETVGLRPAFGVLAVALLVATGFSVLLWLFDPS